MADRVNETPPLKGWGNLVQRGLGRARREKKHKVELGLGQGGAGRGGSDLSSKTRG